MIALRALALGALMMTATGAAPGATGSPPNQNRLPACVNDARGAISLAGYLRIAHQAGGLGSIVQFFPKSDETDYYLDGIKQQLSGRPVVLSQEQRDDPKYLTYLSQRMQSLPQLLGSAKFALADESGKFACSGFLPGDYVLLGTVTALQPAADNGRAGAQTQTYWRADVAIPPPNRRRAYIISGFRFLGQVTR